MICGGICFPLELLNDLLSYYIEYQTLVLPANRLHTVQSELYSAPDYRLKLKKHSDMYMFI